MNSIAFPKMFNNTSTKVIYDYEATLSNLKILLCSNKYALLGDPFFGTNLTRMLYNQNDRVLKDLVIDDIFDAIVKFMPQLRVSRNDINITQKDNKLYCVLKATNILNYTTNLYEINLTSTEE